MNRFFDIKSSQNPSIAKKGSSVWESKYINMHCQKIAMLQEDIKRLPTKEEFFFLQTENSFNAFTFIPLIAQQTTVQHLHICTYSISRRVIDALIELHDKGYCERITLMISDSLIKRNPTTMDILAGQVANRSNFEVFFSWSHAKVSLLKTKEAYYGIEGSGNHSENAFYEQYLFYNSKQAYEFRRELFDNVTVRAKAIGGAIIPN